MFEKLLNLTDTEMMLMIERKNRETEMLNKQLLKEELRCQRLLDEIGNIEERAEAKFNYAKKIEKQYNRMRLDLLHMIQNDRSKSRIIDYINHEMQWHNLHAYEPLDLLKSNANAAHARARNEEKAKEKKKK